MLILGEKLFSRWTISSSLFVFTSAEFVTTFFTDNVSIKLKRQHVFSRVWICYWPCRRNWSTTVCQSFSSWQCMCDFGLRAAIFKHISDQVLLPLFFGVRVCVRERVKAKKKKGFYDTFITDWLCHKLSWVKAYLVSWRFTFFKTATSISQAPHIPPQKTEGGESSFSPSSWNSAGSFLQVGKKASVDYSSATHSN